MDYILRETERHLDYKTLRGPIEEKSPLRGLNDTLGSRDAYSETFRRSGGFIPSSPPAPIRVSEPWYDKQRPKSAANVAQNDIRLDKLESDTAAFRERIIGDLEAAFKNAVKRIETMREDTLRMIRTNAHDLEAQMKLVVANAVQDHNQREVEFRQRMTNQLAQQKRAADHRAHEQALALDRLAQRISGLDGEIKQCNSSVGGISLLDVSQLATKVQQNNVKLEGLMRENKTRTTHATDATDRLQAALDRLSAEVRALRSTQRSQNEQQTLSLDEKIRQVLETQRKRSETFEDQVERRMEEMKKSSNEGLLGAVRDISLEHVRLNSSLVELHKLVDENLAHQSKFLESDHLAREMLRKELGERVGNLDALLQRTASAADTTSKQSAEALELARKAELGRVADRKSIAAFQTETAKYASQVADCKLEVKELASEYKSTNADRAKQLDTLQHTLETLRAESERERKRSARELRELTQNTFTKLAQLKEAQEAHGDEVKATQKMAFDYHEDMQQQVQSLNTTMKTKLDVKTQEYELMRAVRAETKHAVEVLEKRVAAMNSNVKTAVDANVSIRVQEALSKIVDPIEDRIGHLNKSVDEKLAPVSLKLARIETQSRDLKEYVEQIKIKSVVANGQATANLEQKILSQNKKISNLREEWKQEAPLLVKQNAIEIESKLEHRMRQSLSMAQREAIEAKTGSQAIERKINSLEQRMNSSREQIRDEKERIEYCCRMIYDYGVQTIKEADVRSALRSTTYRLCSRVAALETKNGLQNVQSTAGFSKVSAQEAELDEFNQWLQKTHHITPQTRFRTPSSSPTRVGSPRSYTEGLSNWPAIDRILEEKEQGSSRPHTAPSFAEQQQEGSRNLEGHIGAASGAQANIEPWEGRVSLIGHPDYSHLDQGRYRETSTAEQEAADAERKARELRAEAIAAESAEREGIKKAKQLESMVRDAKAAARRKAEEEEAMIARAKEEARHTENLGVRTRLAQAKAECEKAKADAEKAKADAERARMERERAEVETARADAEKAKAEARAAKEKARKLAKENEEVLKLAAAAEKREAEAKAKAEAEAIAKAKAEVKAAAAAAEKATAEKIAQKLAAEKASADVSAADAMKKAVEKVETAIADTETYGEKTAAEKNSGGNSARAGIKIGEPAAKHYSMENKNITPTHAQPETKDKSRSEKGSSRTDLTSALNMNTKDAIMALNNEGAESDDSWDDDDDGMDNEGKQEGNGQADDGAPISKDNADPLVPVIDGTGNSLQADDGGDLLVPVIDNDQASERKESSKTGGQDYPRRTLTNNLAAKALGVDMDDEFSPDDDSLY